MNCGSVEPTFEITFRSLFAEQDLIPGIEHSMITGQTAIASSQTLDQEELSPLLYPSY